MSAQPKKPNAWDRLSPNGKRAAMIGGAISAFLLVTVPFLDSSEPQTSTKAGGPRQVGNLITSSKGRDLGLTSLEREVAELARSNREHKAELERLRAEQGRARTSEGVAGPGRSVLAPSPDSSDEAMQVELERLRARLEAAEQGGGEAPVRTAQEDRQTPPGTQRRGDRGQQGRENVGPPPPPPRPTLRTVAAAPAPAPEKEPAGASAREVKVYMPSGSMIPGILLTGLDAPTGRGAAKDPVPALVRINHHAILPNHASLDIDSCFATLAGTGDLSSERVCLRGERLSCVRNDGGVIDVPLQVYTVDSDSKACLRGNLVSKQGQVIGKAVLAAAAEAASRTFSQSGRSAGIVTGEFDLGGAAENGVSAGASSALDRVAQFYISMASELFPVLEVSAMREVTLVVIRGTELALVPGSAPRKEAGRPSSAR